MTTTRKSVADLPDNTPIKLPPAYPLKDEPRCYYAWDLFQSRIAGWVHYWGQPTNVRFTHSDQLIGVYVPTLGAARRQHREDKAARIALQKLRASATMATTHPVRGTEQPIIRTGKKPQRKIQAVV